MDTITVSLEFLASVLGSDAGTLKEKLSDDQSKNEGFIKDEIIKKIDTARRTGKDESYGRAKREIGEETEKKIAEKFSVEKGNLDSMIEAYIEANKKSFKADPKDIRNSDIYIEDMKAEKIKYQALEQTISTEKQKIENERTTEVVRTKAIEMLSGYVLPEDKVKREKQIDLFVDSIINSSSFKMLDGKKIQIIDKDGNVVRNDLMEELQFDSFLNSKCLEIFDVKKGDDRKSPENKTLTDDKGNPISIPAFKTTSEYLELVYNPNVDQKVREALSVEYDRKISAGEMAE